MRRLVRFWSLLSLLHAPEGEATGGGGGESSDEQKVDPVLAALKSLEQRFDQRFEDMDGKHRKLVEDMSRARKLAHRDGGQGEEKPKGRDGASASTAPTADMGTLWKLSKLTAKLPESAQARIDALVDEGDIERALLVAETLAEVAPAVTAGGSAGAEDETSKRSAPRGYGATPAPRKTTAVDLPKSKAEWLRLAQSDPQGFQKAREQAQRDPTYSMPSA